MRSSRVTIAAILLLGLFAVSCASSKTQTTQPTASPTPTTSIGSCVNNIGTQSPAAPKGVDYKTQLKEQGVLNVGSDNAYPPFESIASGQKDPVGFDVDLYQEVAKRLGLTAKSTTTSFDGLFTSSIPTGTFDLGISAITIKESRKKTVDFTIPYFVANLSLAVDTAKNPNIKTIDNLSGLTIGVQSGTSGEDCGKALVAQGKAKEIKSYETATQAFDDLVAGRVVAVINDTPASVGIIANRAGLKVVQIIETNEKYGFAIGKNKPDLRAAVNKALTDMMKDGTFTSIYKTWFKTDPPFALPIE
jgi:arginine/lysine/histidine/glutamine transport system substrate-binding and permease protein